MKERKLYLEETSGESIKKTSNNIVIFVDSFINFGRYHKIFSIKKLKIVEHIQVSFRRIITAHIALCKSNTRRILI